MNYNNQYQGGYGQQYPQHGGQFHAPQVGYMGGLHNRPQQSGEHEKVIAFFRSVAYGETPCPEELKQIILGVVGEQANGMLAQYGYHQQGGDDQHHRYKEVMEELRDVPNLTDAEKKFDQYFVDLTPDDRKVLKQKVNRPSNKKLAQLTNLTLDRFLEIDHGLPYKLK